MGESFAVSWFDRWQTMDNDAAIAEIARCCGSRRWQREVIMRRPFRGFDDLLAAAHTIWLGLGPDDWREAIAHHPRIGDPAAFARKWEGGEQAGVARASSETLGQLAAANRDYEARFGHIFLICATGLTAEIMLNSLRSRLENSPDQETAIVRDEQAKITRLRLERLNSA
jgi:2-oxo-4-hydroxy-4-carboxy-5-ureidoimidazoline decarboxylase